MKNFFEGNEVLLNSASEVASACLDMEGGAFFLVWSSELIRDLAAEGYVRSATLAARKLCKAVSTDCVQAERDELESTEKRACLNLFIETLKTYYEI